jgi:hypothetical protein
MTCCSRPKRVCVMRFLARNPISVANSLELRCWCSTARRLLSRELVLPVGAVARRKNARKRSAIHWDRDVCAVTCHRQVPDARQEHHSHFAASAAQVGQVVPCGSTISTECWDQPATTHPVAHIFASRRSHSRATASSAVSPISRSSESGALLAHQRPVSSHDR